MLFPFRFVLISSSFGCFTKVSSIKSPKGRDILHLIPIASFTRGVLPCRYIATSSLERNLNCLKHESAKYTKFSTMSGHHQAVSAEEVATGFLNAKDAAALDEELMSQPGFSLEQLMELAGLSVAEAVYEAFPLQHLNSTKEKPMVLLVCGPGNNGGDGLVAARHLYHFGYDCSILYPKRSSKTHFVNLVKQCEDLSIPFLNEMPSNWEDTFDLVVDAIFGFSFHGTPREPFDGILEAISGQRNVPILSVDVPSGWNVDEGDVAGTGFMPDVLVSLTTPKHCSKSFTGRHFIGGRFLPPKLAEKYRVKMPPYPKVSQVMEITVKDKEANSDWATQYASYCGDTDEKLSNQDLDKLSAISIAGSDGPSEGWAAEYDKYLAEKADAEKHP